MKNKIPYGFQTKWKKNNSIKIIQFVYANYEKSNQQLPKC
jgi:hypothetical protein